MRYAWIFGLQLWACQALAIEPGSDFNVDLTWPPFVQSIQQLEPTTLHFKVSGCDDFKAEAKATKENALGGLEGLGYPLSSPSVTVTPLQVVADSHGGYTASFHAVDVVPQPEFSCGASRNFPTEVPMQLIVTCRSDGREASSVPFRLLHAATDDAVSFVVADSIHSLDGNRVLAAGPGRIQIIRLDRRGRDRGPSGMFLDSVGQSAGLVNSSQAMAHTDTEAFVAAHCVFPHCRTMVAEDPLTHASITTQSTDIYGVDTVAAQDGNLVKSVVQVPGHVVKMLPDGDGSLLVLSRPERSETYMLWDANARIVFPSEKSGFIISRVQNGQVFVEKVDIEASVLDVGTGDDAHFASVTAGTFWLHNLHAPRDAQPMRGPDPDTRFISVAPDGQQWVFNRNETIWLSGASGAPVALADSQPADTSGSKMWPPVQVVWLDDTVALKQGLWRATHVDFYDRRSGAITSTFMPPTDAVGVNDNDIGRMLAVGPDRLIAVGMRDVRVLDGRGNVLGGTKSTPGCGFPTDLQPLHDNKVGWLTYQHANLMVFDAAPYLN